MITMGARRRRSRDKADTGGQRTFEKAMFSFMGPAQIGENRAPEGYVPDESANLCHKCRQPWDAHERVHTGTMTYRRCPAD
jgi:hypothetical protein